MGSKLERLPKHPGIYKVLNAEGEWGGSYKTSYRVNGRQHWKSFQPPDALRNAEAFRASVSTRRGEGTLIDPRAGRVTLASLYEDLHRTRDYAGETLMVHGVVWRKIEPVLGSRFVNQIDQAAVEGLLDSLRATPSLQEKTRNLLSVLFKRAVQRKLIRESPMPPRPAASTRAERQARGAKNTRPKRILSDEQLGNLLDEMAPKYRALVLLMARMGLRPGEAVTLTVGKFWPPIQAPERARGRLVISTSISGSTKTGEVRELALPDAISKVLSDHIAAYSDPLDPDAPMFTTETGLTIGTRNRYMQWTRRYFTPAAVRAGIDEGFSPNDLRHTAAAWTISLGGSVYDVQRMLGHSKASITLDTYGALFDSQQTDLVRRQDEALGALGTPALPAHP